MDSADNPDSTHGPDGDAAVSDPTGSQPGGPPGAWPRPSRWTRTAYRLGAAALLAASASVVAVTILVSIAEPDPEPLAGADPESVTLYYTSAMWIVPYVLLLVATFALMVGVAAVYLRLRAEADRRAVFAGGVGTVLLVLGLLPPFVDFFARALVAPMLAQAGAYGALEQVLGIHLDTLSPTLLAGMPVGAIVLLLVLLWVGAMPRWATTVVAVGVIALVQTIRGVESGVAGILGLVLLAVGLTGWALSLWKLKRDPD